MKPVLLILLFLFAGGAELRIEASEVRRVVLDADTANEVDDLFAVVRALIEPSWEVVALNATQWQTSLWATPNTMEESHRLNQMLVSYLKLDDRVRTRRGGEARMYDWGDKARYSAATRAIIEEAHATPKGEKLVVIALGALTNVASALWIDPSIAPKIKLYWLGSSIDFDTGVITTIDFNAMMDMQAVHLVYHSNVELHVLPKEVSIKMAFDYAETRKRFQGKHPLTDFLVQRWFNHLDGGRYHRHIWDLALVGAMVNPQWAEEVLVRTSAEYGARDVWYFRDIDATAVKAEFFDSVLAYLRAL